MQSLRVSKMWLQIGKKRKLLAVYEEQRFYIARYKVSKTKSKDEAVDSVSKISGQIFQRLAELS